MFVRVLGGFTVDVDGDSHRQIVLRPKERALGAALALRAGQEVSAWDLIDAMWGASPPVGERKALQTHVLRLRQALGSEVVGTTGSGYRLHIDPGQVDAHGFERGARAELDRDQRPTAEDDRRLAAVLDLWQGVPFADLGEWPPAVAQRLHLAQLRADLVERRAEGQLTAGRASIGALEALVAEDPLRERRWALLIQALSQAGRRAEALRAYDRARQLLAAELGLSPGPELVHLQASVLADDPAGAFDATPRSRTVDDAARSARECVAAGDLDQAADRFAKAVSAAEESGASYRVIVDLLLELAQVHHERLAVSDAVEAADQAARLARSHDDTTRLALAALAAAADGWVTGLDPTAAAIELLDEALTELAPAPTALRARLLARLAVAESQSRPLADAVGHAQEAVRLARVIDADDCMAVALHAQLVVDQDLMRVRERTACAEALGALAEANESPRWEGWALPHLSRLAATRGDRIAYDAAVERMNELAVGPGQGPLRYAAASAPISAATLVADFAAARRAIVAARVVGEAVLPDPAAAALAEMGELGMIDLLDGTVAEAALIEITYPQPSIDAAAKAWTAAAHLQLGHPEAARAAVAAFDGAALTALPRDVYWPTVVAIMAGVLRSLGDAERGRLPLRPGGAGRRPGDLRRRRPLPGGSAPPSRSSGHGRGSGATRPAPLRASRGRARRSGSRPLVERAQPGHEAPVGGHFDRPQRIEPLIVAVNPVGVVPPVPCPKPWSRESSPVPKPLTTFQWPTAGVFGSISSMPRVVIVPVPHPAIVPVKTSIRLTSSTPVGLAVATPEAK